MTDSYDYIIVGAGTAGCVLAHRLSADPACRVLLLEAGGRNRSPAIRIPAGMSQAIAEARFNWQYAVEEDHSRAGRPDQWAAGKGLGGSSAINGLFYDRGHAEDYDDWARAGCEGWSYEELEPFFQRAESPVSSAQEEAARPGISLCELPHAHPLSSVFLEAVRECGTPLVNEADRGGASGASLVTVTENRGARDSAADGYLGSLRRPNLVVRTGAQVARLHIDGARCTGVTFRIGRSEHRAEAGRELLLCAGAIGTPKLLMLSGIGDAQALASHGIDCVADLPGVGCNLQEHPLAMLGQRVDQRTYNLDARQPWRVAAFLARWFLQRSGPATSPFSQAAAFFPGPSGAGRPELEVLFAPHYFEWSADGPKPYAEPAVLGIASLCRPRSRGQVSLASADATAPPRISHAMLGDAEDLAGLIRGCRIVRDIFAADSFAVHARGELMPGPEVDSDEAWEAFLRQSVVGGNHLVGTARMGTDGESVVSSDLKVHGVDGLRVVDASVMPTLPSTHTNATVLAIAEKAAALILSENRGA